MPAAPGAGGGTDPHPDGGRSARSFPGPARIDQARRHFFRQYDELVAELAGAARPHSQPAPEFRLLPKFHLHPALALASAVALLALGLLVRRQLGPSLPAAPAVLASTESAQQRLEQRAAGMRQVFHVEWEDQARRQQRAGRLEVWSDASGGRFALCWSDSAGLRQAVWRPAAGQEYGYDAAATPRQAVWVRSGTRPQALAGAVGSDLNVEGMERALGEWLRRRPWRPVSLAADFALFCRQDGAAHLRRGPALLRRDAVALRPQVPRPTGTPRGGLHRRPQPGHLHRAENHQPQHALHRRRHHRNLRLPPPAQFLHRRPALPAVRAPDRAPDLGADPGAQAGRAHHDPGPHRARPQGRIPQGPGETRQAGFSPRPR